MKMVYSIIINLNINRIIIFFFFWLEGKMAKYFIDVVQDSPSTGLDIPVKTRTSIHGHRPVWQAD